jgi:hypothetical protein
MFSIFALNKNENKTSSGQKTLKQNNFKQQKEVDMKKIITHFSVATMLLLAIVVETNATGLEAKAADYEETILSFENWMTDESVWNNASLINVDLTLETESSLELENWMTSSNFLSANIQFEIETETQLKVENWMTDSIYWEFGLTEVDQKLELESWMTDSRTWR